MEKNQRQRAKDEEMVEKIIRLVERDKADCDYDLFMTFMGASIDYKDLHVIVNIFGISINLVNIHSSLGGRMKLMRELVRSYKRKLQRQDDAKMEKSINVLKKA